MLLMVGTDAVPGHSTDTMTGPYRIHNSPLADQAKWQTCSCSNRVPSSSRYSPPPWLVIFLHPLSAPFGAGLYHYFLFGSTISLSSPLL